MCVYVCVRVCVCLCVRACVFCSYAILVMQQRLVEVDELCVGQPDPVYAPLPRLRVADGRGVGRHDAVQLGSVR